MLKLDLAEAGEVVSDAFFTAMILNCHPTGLDSVVAVLKLTSTVWWQSLNFVTVKGYYEMKQDLVLPKRHRFQTLPWQEASKVFQVR